MRLPNTKFGMKLPDEVSCKLPEKVSWKLPIYSEKVSLHKYYLNIVRIHQTSCSTTINPRKTIITLGIETLDDFLGCFAIFTVFFSKHKIVF